MASRKGIKGERGGSEVRLPYYPALTDILAGRCRSTLPRRRAKKIDCAAQVAIMMTVKKLQAALDDRPPHKR